MERRGGDGPGSRTGRTGRIRVHYGPVNEGPDVSLVRYETGETVSPRGVGWGPSTALGLLVTTSGEVDGGYDGTFRLHPPPG